MEHDPPPQDQVADASTLSSVVDALPAMVAAVEGPELRMVHVNPAALSSSARTDWRGRPLAEVYPEMVAQGVIAVYEQVLRTGVPVHEPERRVELLDPADGSVVERFLSFSVVPWARPDGSRDGVVVLAHDVSDRVHERREVERLAAETGHRYRQVLDVVDELQRALLPADVPVLPRTDVAARYLVAGEEQSAGGDWFDVRPLPDGRVALVVGDVVGHGVAAAAVMSQLRAVLSVALDTTPDLTAAVEQLEGFAASVPGARATTVVVAVLDPVGRTVEYLTRGHPAPLLVTPAGEARQLLAGGAGPLGTGSGRPGVRQPAQWTEIGEGDVLVLFSDGLVERADRSFTEGLDELTRLAGHAVVGQIFPSGTSPSAAERICSHAVDLLTRRGYLDDVTVLAAGVQAPVPPLTVHVPATEEHRADLRGQVHRWLHRLRVGTEDRLAVMLAVDELVDNAVEHGFDLLPTGTVVVSLALGGDGWLSVAVDDSGAWRDPAHTPAGRGTGLSLVEALGERLRVDGQVTGTSVTFSRRLSRPVTGGPTGAAAVRVPAPEDRYVATVSGDPPLVRVRGAVDALSADRFRRQVFAVSRGGTGPLTIDLAQTSQLTSVGVAVLVDLLGARRADHHDEAPVTLLAPTGTPAAYVLDLVGLPRRTG